jgi:hypothetical protein
VAKKAFLSVTEAATVLGISRTTAYEQASRYRRTGGASGLPVVEMGARLLVPRARLEDLAAGPLDLDDDEPGGEPHDPAA